MNIQAGNLYGPAPRAGRHYSVEFGSRHEHQEGPDEDRTAGREHSWAAWAARFLKNRRAAGAVFEPLTLRDYECAIARASDDFGLTALRLVPHVLRHTGPSADAFQNNMSSGDIKARGKWASDLSVSRYEKRGMVLRQLSRLSATQQSQATAVARSLPALLRALPFGPDAPRSK